MRLLPPLMIGCLLTCAHAAEPVRPSTTQSTSTATLPAAFDSARHMRIDQVRPGMKGYGLTVLSGTSITKFEVEVISVLKNAFGPDQSVVMVRCNDDFMKHTGPIQGCSGSPIFLYDDAGTPKLIGAYAYGFEWVRDPIIGVQPIEYMLGLQKSAAPEEPSADASWSLLKSKVFTTMALTNGRTGALLSTHQTKESPSGSKLRPLMIPLSVQGMSQTQLDLLAPTMRAHGLEPMLAIGGGQGDGDGNAEIEPGSLLGAALLTGDLNMAAIGTCTEVIDGRAYGFGHPFMGEGKVSIPMGAGSVNLVMQVLSASFKLGSVERIHGAIDTDGTFGIAGDLGGKAQTFPISVTIHDESIGVTKNYRYECAVHPQLSPMITGAAIQSSMTSQKELPHNHTVDYRAELKFAQGPTLEMSGIVSSTTGENVTQNVMWPAMLLADNPFGKAFLQGVKLEATIRPTTDAAELLSAHATALSYKPGETALIQLRLKPFRGEVFEKQVEVKLPDDLTDGDYSVSITDASTNLQYDVQARPNEYVVRNLNELYSTLETVIGKSRGDRLFVRFSGTRQNVAIGRTQLSRLPASKRSILEAAARPDTVGSVETRVTSMDMGRVVTGSADLVLHVARKLP